MWSGEREDEEVIYWIWLMMVPGIGSHFVHRAADAGFFPKEIFGAFSDNDAEHMNCISERKSDYKPDSGNTDTDPTYSIFTEKKIQTLRHFAKKENLEKALSVLRQCRKADISVCVLTDQEYPDRMRNIPDMPPVLYVRGRLNLNGSGSSCGIIGSRRCSGEDKKTAIQIAEESCREGKAVISGMAKGIDGYAHTAVIKNSGYTVAVLGNGPDICYPPENDSLMKAVIEDGAVISSYPPGTAPRRYFFPARNRIIAALSDELYVIGAGRESGTESTAEYYQRLGKGKLYFYNTACQEV